MSVPNDKRRSKGAKKQEDLEKKKHFDVSLIKDDIIDIIKEHVNQKFTKPLNKAGTTKLNSIIYFFLLNNDINLDEYDQDTLACIYSAIITKIPEMATPNGHAGYKAEFNQDQKNNKNYFSLYFKDPNHFNTIGINTPLQNDSLSEYVRKTLLKDKEEKPQREARRQKGIEERNRRISLEREKREARRLQRESDIRNLTTNGSNQTLDANLVMDENNGNIIYVLQVENQTNGVQTNGTNQED